MGLGTAMASWRCFARAVEGVPFVGDWARAAEWDNGRPEASLTGRFRDAVRLRDARVRSDALAAMSVRGFRSQDCRKMSCLGLVGGTCYTLNRLSSISSHGFYELLEKHKIRVYLK